MSMADSVWPPKLSSCISFMQVIQIPFPFCKLVYGTGVISVAGISFTFLTTAQGSIDLMMVSCNSYHHYPYVLSESEWPKAQC